MSMLHHQEWLGAKATTDASAPLLSQPIAEASASTGGSKESEGSKTASIIIGMAAIGGLIGHSLYKARIQGAPQVCFPNGTAPETLRGDPVRIAFVNLAAAEQPLATKALREWLPLGEADSGVTVAFERVTFFEANAAVSITGLDDAVRRATLEADQVLRHRLHRKKGGSTDGTSAEKSPHRLVTVVYRSALALDSAAVELMTSNLATLRRADGMAFQEHHCLGFTVDGHGVAVLCYDVTGVVDALQAERAWAAGSTADAMERASAARVLRSGCVPTQATLRQHLLDEARRSRSGFSAFGDHAMGSVSASQGSSAATDKKRLPQVAPAARSELGCTHGDFWSSPLHLFSEFAAVLSLSRPQWDGYRQLLGRLPEEPAALRLRGVTAALARLLWLQPKGSSSSVAELQEQVKAGGSSAGLALVPLSGRYYTVVSVRVRGLDEATAAIIVSQSSAIAEHVVGRRALCGGENAVPIVRQPPTLITPAAEDGTISVVVSWERSHLLCTALQIHRFTLHLASFVACLGLPLVRAAVAVAAPSGNLTEAFSGLLARPLLRLSETASPDAVAAMLAARLSETAGGKCPTVGGANAEGYAFVYTVALLPLG